MVFEGIKRSGADYLIGSPSFVRTDGLVEYYNSAYLIIPEDKTMGKYDKTHLVPFGEYVPFKKWLPFLGKIVAQVGDFKAGKVGQTLPWRNEQLGVQICYEIIFPGLSRAMVKNNASVLVNITNDAWFGKTSGPYQHFSMTVFRAVENRRSLARSANTGISGFIDPAGRILASTDLMQDAVATQMVPMLKERSIYTQIGDLFARICLALVLLIILIEIVRRKTNRKMGSRKIED
jgi:apolipoprotein N-acyltransferase